MFSRKGYFIVITIIFSSVFISCSDSSTGSEEDPITFSNSRYRFTNSIEEIERRYTETDIEIPVDTNSVEKSSARSKIMPPSFTLTQVSELAPPQVNGVAVQSTMIYTDGSSQTLIAYNQRGEPYQGAIDMAQITGNGRNIRIRSAIQFFDADINAVFDTGNELYAAVATNNSEIVDEGERSAAIGFSRSGFDIIENSDLSYSAPSFAANSIKVFNNKVYMTTGNTGGLTVLNAEMSNELSYTEIAEARWVDVTASRIVVLAGDTNGNDRGTIYVLDPQNYQITAEYSFTGAYTPEAKNTVEVVNHLAFIAAGKEGMQVMDLRNGNILSVIPIPDPASLGLSPDVVATNAVSVDENKIFISNGEAGVYVAETDKAISSYSPGEDLSTTLIGKLQFNDLESVNHVSYKNKLLIVAAGRGGTKSVALTER